MKRLLSTMILSSLLSAVAMAAAPKVVLSKAEQKLVLNEIDNLCGDTWCEGEYEFDFTSFDCSAAVDGTNCELVFSMSKTNRIYAGERHGVIPVYKKVFPVACEMGPFLNQSDIFTKSSGTDSIILADSFVNKVGLCIALLEASLPKEK